MSALWRRKCVVVGLFCVLAAAAGVVAPSSVAGVCEGMEGAPGDLDGDGFAGAVDCDDTDPGVATTAGEVSGVVSPPGVPHRFVWDAAADLGGSSPTVSYEVLRSESASDFLTHPSATCLDVGGQDREATDPADPPAGAVFYYLVRARTECGAGDSGAGTSGTPRATIDCDCAVLCDDADACTVDRCDAGSCVHEPIPPGFLRQPSDTHVCDGGTARFEVRVVGSGSASYQWTQNGLPVGLDSPVLELPALGAADDGSAIVVEVTDGCASAVSEVARLTVFADPASCAGGLDGQEAPNGAGTPAEPVAFKKRPPKSSSTVFHDATRNFGIGRRASSSGGGHLGSRVVGLDDDDSSDDDSSDDDERYAARGGVRVGGALTVGGGTFRTRNNSVDDRSMSRDSMSHDARRVARGGVSVGGTLTVSGGALRMLSGSIDDDSLSDDSDAGMDRLGAGGALSVGGALTVSGGSLRVRAGAIDDDSISDDSDDGMDRVVSGGTLTVGGALTVSGAGLRVRTGSTDDDSMSYDFESIDDPHARGGPRGGGAVWVGGAGLRARASSIDDDSLSDDSDDDYDRVVSAGVHLHSGELYAHATDLVIPGRGMDLTWKRHYRSREWRDTSMGVGWTHSYDRWIEPDPGAPGSFLLHAGDSRVDSFAPDGTGCFVAPGFFEQLCPDPGGGHVLTFPDEQTWTFAPFDGLPGEGRIVQARDRYGNTMTFAYDGLGRLTTITDTLGRDVTVAYNARNLVASVTDFTGRTVSYAYYDGLEAGGELDDLESVTSPAVTGTPTGNDFPGGKTDVYTYTQGSAIGELNHNLLSITDGAGDTWLEVVYGTEQNPAAAAFDRVYELRRLGPAAAPPVASLQLAYVVQTPAAGNGQAVSKTILNDGAGNVSEYFYDALGRLVIERDRTGRAPDAAAPTDDAQNAPVGALRPGDPASFDTRYEYDAASLVTRVVMPNGNEVQLVYDSQNQNVRKRGDLLTRTLLPGPLGGDQVSITESWVHGTDLGTDRGGRSDARVSKPGHSTRRRVEVLKSNGRSAGKEEGGRHTPFHNKYRPQSAARAFASKRGYDYYQARKDVVAAGRFAFATSYTDRHGHNWGMTHDAENNVIDMIAPPVVTGTPGGVVQNIAHHWDYNAFGQPTRYTDPTGRIVEWTYYAAGPQRGYLQSTVEDPLGLALTTTYEYDSLGRVTRLTEPNGHATDVVYNALDQVVRVSDVSFPYQTDFYYDAADRVVRRDVRNVDETGALRPDSHLTKDWAYDGLGRVVRVRAETGPGQCVSEGLEWDANDNIERLRSGVATTGEQPTNVVGLFYDERDLLFRVIDAEGDPVDLATDQLDYDPNGNPSAVHLGLEDPSGPDTTTYVYDGYDRLAQRVDAEGNQTSLHYDAASNPVSLRVDGELIDGVSGIDVRLYETFRLYDEIDRPVREDVQHFDVGSGAPIGDGQATTLRFYDEASRRVRVEDDNGHGTDLHYDAVGRLELVTDAAGDTAGLTYDANSNVTDLTATELSDLGGPPEVYVTQYEYDALDRRTAVIDPAQARAEVEYDSRGLRVTARDRMGNVVLRSYDGLGRLLVTSRDLTDTGDGQGVVVDTQVVSREWDDASRVVAATDPNGNVTTYDYDARNRLVHAQTSDNTGSNLNWDFQGNLVGVTDADGSVQTRVYDGLGRLVSRSVLPAPGVAGTTVETYAYSGAGSMVRVSDDDTQVSWHHDSLGNPLVEIQQTFSGAVQPQVVVRDWDAVGNLTTLTYPSGLSVRYQYDALDRLSGVLVGPTPVATYDWAGPGRPARVTRASGVTTDYGYDAARRPSTRVHALGGVPFLEQTFTWSPASNRTSTHETWPGGATRDTQYTYDSLHRLVGSTLTVSPAPPEIVQYTLDLAGNRVDVTGGPDAGPYTMDPSLPEPADAQVNQYTSTPSGARQYDRNGNTVLLFGGLSEERALVHDFRGRLTQVSYPGTTLDYVHDALGRTLERSDGGTSLAWSWGGGRELERLSGGAPELAFVYGAGGELLQMVELADLNANLVLDVYDYHTDDARSVVALSDASGALVERYDYADFGTPLYFDGAGSPLASSAVHNPYVFRSWRRDDEALLYRGGGNGYDSRTGRGVGGGPGRAVWHRTVLP